MKRGRSAAHAAESPTGHGALRRVSVRARAAVADRPLTLLGGALAIGALVALHRSGWMLALENTLQVMGFDPDRASLLGALIGGATGAAIVGLVGGGFRVGVVVGTAAVLAGFWTTFRHESGAALRSRPPEGVFDPIGWTVAVVTIVVVALVVAWASTVLATDVRAAIEHSAVAARSLVRGRDRRPRAVLPVVGAIATVALLALALPTFGDMMNFDPDYAMRRDAPVDVGLFGTNDAGAGVSDGGPSPVDLPGPAYPSASAAAGGPAGAHGVGLLAPPADLVAGPLLGSFVSPGALSSERPWAAHPPTGGGRSYSVDLPPPWVGGMSDHATIDVYLPPGYDSSTARYPVIYEPHQPQWAWDRGMHFSSVMDTLIRSGTIPPEIVIFMDQLGGPYPDSQCADSWDGREWFDRYMGQIVPAWADAHLRTIPTPAARALLGFSTGGYCAAAALTHHPDVFRSAIIFSGYFVAGIRTTTTPTAYRPFNGDSALEARQSPINIVPAIDPAARSSMFVAFSADPASHLYAGQITAFARVLDANGVAMAILPTRLGHSWAAVRDQVPTMLALLAARQAELRVFAGA